MEKSNPKISVIVPVYNVEQYLRRCIDSILAQTFTDFEVLLIDDGSKDKSGEICDEYAKKDIRVKVFHKENGGVSSARNVGLDNARGEWVTFVDSDDWVEKDYLEHFSMNFDLCVQSYFYGNELIEFSNKEIISNPGEDYLLNEYVYGPYCKLYKRQIISVNHILFDINLAYGEDVLFWLEYLCYCKSMKVQKYAGYHYILYPNNTLKNAPQKIEKMLLMFKKHVEYFEKLLYGSIYKDQIMRKEIFNMFHDFIIDYGIRYKVIKKNEFLMKNYRNHLNLLDKIIILSAPSFIHYYKRFLVKYHLL